MCHYSYLVHKVLVSTCTFLHTLLIQLSYQAELSLQQFHDICIVHQREIKHVDPLLLVLVLDGVKVIEHILLLQALIGVVDTELFKSVNFEAFKTKYIQERDSAVCICHRSLDLRLRCLVAFPYKNIKNPCINLKDLSTKKHKISVLIEKE